MRKVAQRLHNNALLGDAVQIGGGPPAQLVCPRQMQSERGLCIAPEMPAENALRNEFPKLS